MTQPWQRDPYQRRPVDIEAYAPPRRAGAGIAWLVALGLVLMGSVAAALVARPPLPGAAPTPSNTPSETAQGPGMPFTMPGSTQSRGRWEVLEHVWSDAGVVVRVRVTSDGGRVTYGFVAFSNTGNEVYEPEAGAPAPEIGSGRLNAGQSIEGNLFLRLPRGPATLILTTEAGRQMSALPIPG